MREDLLDGNAMAAEIADELRDELGELTFDQAVKHLPAVPSVREVRTLLDCARGSPRDYFVVRLLYYTGVRVGELTKFCFADVNATAATLFVREGKGGRDRYVCVDAESLRLIHEEGKDKTLADRLVELRPREIDRIVHEYGKRAGLVQKYEAMGRSFSPHSLRHAFATHRHDAGMDLAIIQKLLGHRFLATTLIYVETSMRLARKAYHKTDPLHER